MVSSFSCRNKKDDKRRYKKKQLTANTIYGLWFKMQYEYKRDVDWNKDLVIGSKQESKFEIFMKSFGYVVEDTSKIKEYQDIDVDFKVTNTKGITNLFEVKQDKTLATYNYNIRRLCIEDISSIKDMYGRIINTDGWYKKCLANYLVIGDNKNEMYMYKIADLHEYIDMFSGDKDRIYDYQLGNSMIHGVFQKKFDDWLIANNKVCKVFNIDTNKCKNRKEGN